MYRNGVQSHLSCDGSGLDQTPTPRRAAPLLIPLPRAAARLIAKQLSKNPVNLKNATLEMDLSSRAVREDAKIDRKPAGVTGMPLSGGVGGPPTGALKFNLALAAVTVGVEDVEADEGMFVVVGSGRGRVARS